MFSEALGGDGHGDPQRTACDVESSGGGQVTDLGAGGRKDTGQGHLLPASPPSVWLTRGSTAATGRWARADAQLKPKGGR